LRASRRISQRIDAPAIANAATTLVRSSPWSRRKFVIVRTTPSVA
jgi:hypothetical protein